MPTRIIKESKVYRETGQLQKEKIDHIFQPDEEGDAAPQSIAVSHARCFFVAQVHYSKALPSHHGTHNTRRH
jgi:hypothetical protein